MRDLDETELGALENRFTQVVREVLPKDPDPKGKAEQAVRAVRMRVWSDELASWRPALANR